MDSQNILELINKYSQGSSTPSEEKAILDYLQNNPTAISDEGMDVLVDKLVYEQSLLESKAIFGEMMNNQPSPFIKPIVISVSLILIALITYFVLRNTPNNPESIPSLIPVDSAKNIQTKIQKDTLVLRSKKTSKVTTEIPYSTKEVTENNLPTANAKQMNADSIIKDTLKKVNEPLPQPENNDTQAVLITDKKPIKKTLQPATKECPDYTKQVKVKTIKSLQDDGAIILSTNNSNLEFCLDNYSFTTEVEFLILAPKVYTVYIRDNTTIGCVSKIENIAVEQTNCTADYKKDMSVNGTWSLDVNTDNLKSISILNIKGQEIYKQTSNFDNNFEWDGTNRQGIQVPEGLYKAIFEYQKETCIFNVSILK